MHPPSPFLLISLLLPFTISLPLIPPLFPTIPTPFTLLTYIPNNPTLHNRPLTFHPAGGGDHHLYLGPVHPTPPNPPLFKPSNLTLQAGVLTTSIISPRTGRETIIRAVVNGEYTRRDNTTKIFFTQRGDPRAYFTWDVPLPPSPPEEENPGIPRPPTGDELDIIPLRLKLLKGDVCVRLASGGRYEFRSSPEGNTAPDMVNCFKIGLQVIFDGDGE